MTPATPPVWLDSKSRSLEQFWAHVERKTNAADVTWETEIIANIHLYYSPDIRKVSNDPDAVRDLTAEWHRVFLSGAGIVILRKTYDDLSLVERVTDILGRLIAKKRQSQGGSLYGCGFKFQIAECP